MRPFTSALAMAGALTFASTAALAMPVTHSLTATMDGTPLVTLPTGPGAIVDAQVQVFAPTFGGGFPFVLNDGDTIEIDFTVTGPGLTLTDLGVGEDEFLVTGVFQTSSLFDFGTDNPGGAPVLHYDRSTTVTVTNFTGDYPGNPIVSGTASTFATSPSVTMFSRGNYTDSTVTLFEFTISSTFSNFVLDPAFSAFSGPLEITGGSTLLAVDQVTPAPAPGALAMMGFGLIGLIAARRRIH